MSDNKKDLIKLLDFILEITATPNNNWFKKELVNKLNFVNTFNGSNNSEISEIHEYCIKQILNDQAKMFYRDFKLVEINNMLCNDFVRMEQFRREDNFEEFCMAMFQQIEQIVNALFDSKMKEYIINNKHSIISSWQDKETGRNTKIELWQYLFSKNLDRHNNENTLNSTGDLNIDKLHVKQKYKAILYFYYFNQQSQYYNNYKNNIGIFDELYQIRNLNHRGGPKYPNQVLQIEKVKADMQKYYFKFLGYFEDFVSKVNKFII